MVVGGRPVMPLDTFVNPYDPRTSDEARDLLLWLAFRDVGLKDPTPFCAAVGLDPDFQGYWCGIWALAKARQAGLCDWDWEIGLGYCYKLNLTDSPVMGDTAVYRKNWHHAIWVGDGTGRLIQGNGAGGKVTVTDVDDVGEPDFFYSIQPWVVRFDNLPGEAS